MRRFSGLCVCVVLTGVVSAQQRTKESFRDVANRMVKAINGEDYDALRQEFNPTMLKAFPVEKCRTFFQGLVKNAGAIKKVEAPEFQSPAIAIVVVRCERAVLAMTLTLDEQGKVAGMLFKPHADIPTPAKNVAKLALPFKDRWLVVWGGDSEKLNSHFGDRAQHFAFDMVGVDADGKTHRRAGSDNEDFYAFGREILAPADGVVTEVIDGVRDNVPGTMNRLSALGNAVFIQHGKDEVSVIAHLKQGSTCVKAGERVKQGQVVGLCSNSGNSSEPHLHYHLQNTPIIQKATGIKCCFEAVELEKNGSKAVQRNYSPIKEDIISSAK